MARKLKGQGEFLSGSPSPNFTNFSPKPIQANRAPTSADTGYEIGQLWADTNGTTMYGLSAVSAGSATWNLLGPGASDVDTLTGDSGGAISPVGGNIDISGGTNITTVGTAGTITYNLDAAITLATSVTSPLYTAAAATDVAITAPTGQDIVLKMGDDSAANKVSFIDSNNAEVFSIDSNGGLPNLGAVTMTGLLTAQASATIDTAGTALNLGTDNSGDAVNIGTGTVARDIHIGDSAAAHTLTIGSVTGAASLDLQAGTGNFSVVGAATTTYTIGAATDTGVMTLGLSTAGQDINIGSGVNAGAQVISIGNGASAADSTVNILSGVGTAGTGTLALGNNTRVTTVGLADIAPAAARTVTICGGDSAQNDTLSIMSDNPSAGSQTVTVLGGVPTGGTQVLNLLTQTGQAGTVNIATGAAMANAINIGGTGANTVAIANTQTGGSYSVGAAMTTGTISIGGTGAQTGNFTLAPSTGAQTIALGNEDGTKTINIGAGVDGNTISIGNGINTSAQIVNISGGAAGANSTVNVLSGNATAGTQTLNLGTGTGGKAINVGTGAGANTVTVGSTNTTSSLVLQSGTGEITVTGTVKEIDAEFLEASGAEISTISSSPIMSTAANTGGAATGATGDTNLMMMQNGIVMEQFILGAGQTIIAPRIDANGLLISLDLTASEGAEYNFGPRNLSPYAFTIGTDAAFFFEVGLYINDMDGAAPYVIGFRKVEANNATFGNYTDYATIGMIAASSTTNIVTATEVNSGGQTVTDTTDAWGGDGSTNTLRVLVDASGNVTYTINGSAPSASAAFQFDNTDVVIPFIRVEHSASATEVDITSLKVGYQA